MVGKMWERIREREKDEGGRAEGGTEGARKKVRWREKDRKRMNQKAEWRKLIQAQQRNNSRHTRHAIW